MKYSIAKTINLLHTKLNLYTFIDERCSDNVLDFLTDFPPRRVRDSVILTRREDENMKSFYVERYPIF